MMRDGDRQEFRRLMERAGDVYCEDISHRLKPYWELLAPRLDIAAFAGALEAHMADPERGRFFPRPAECLRGAPGDGRPSPDEAWAVAILARDEAETVCWTSEIAEATSAAWPILDIGDKVGARLAFLSAYERIVFQARLAVRPVTWALSFGHDAERRATAAERAVREGRIAADRVAHLLPNDGDSAAMAELAKRLTGKVVDHPARPDGEHRQRMEALRAAIAEGETELAREKAEQQERDRQRKEQEAAERMRLTAEFAQRWPPQAGDAG